MSKFTPNEVKEILQSFADAAQATPKCPMTVIRDGKNIGKCENPLDTGYHYADSEPIECSQCKVVICEACNYAHCYGPNHVSNSSNDPKWVKVCSMVRGPRFPLPSYFQLELVLINLHL